MFCVPLRPLIKWQLLRIVRNLHKTIIDLCWRCILSVIVTIIDVNIAILLFDRVSHSFCRCCFFRIQLSYKAKHCPAVCNAAGTLFILQSNLCNSLITTHAFQEDSLSDVISHILQGSRRKGKNQRNRIILS